MGKSKKDKSGDSDDDGLAATADLSDIRGMEPPSADNAPNFSFQEKKMSKKKKFLKKFRKSLSHNSHKNREGDTDDDEHERRIPDHTRSAGEEQLKQNMWSEKIKGFRKGKGGRRGSTATGSDFVAQGGGSSEFKQHHHHSQDHHHHLSDKEEPLDRDLGYVNHEEQAPTKAELGYDDVDEAALGYSATPTDAELGYSDATPAPTPSAADLGYGDPDVADLGYGDATPSDADLGYGDPDGQDLGYGKASPDLGYGNAGPDLGYGDPDDLGYGKAGPDLGYGEDLGYENQDLGYNSDTPEPPKRSQGVRRRCSVTKYNLEEGATENQNSNDDDD